MRTYERAVVVALLVLAAISFGLVFFTRSWTDYRERLRALHLASSGATARIDTSPLDTAGQVSQLAVTRTEQSYGQEALRLGDHIVDLEFDSAMRDATENPAPLTAQTREITARIKKAETSVASDQNSVMSLTRALAKVSAADKEDVQELLGVAQAQLSLDQDDLEDAHQDLIRAGGDKQAVIQQLLDQHNASEAHTNETHPAAAAAATASSSIELSRNPSIVSQSQAWFSLPSKEKLLVQAQQDGLARIGKLSVSHDALDKQLEQEKTQKKSLHNSTASALYEPKPEPGTAASATSASEMVPAAPVNPALSLIHDLAADQKDLSDLDKRIGFEKQLAALYGSWIEFVDARQRSFVHEMVLSALWIFLIALFALAANYGLKHIFAGVALERRRLHTFRILTLFIVQALGILLILMVIFGIPSNLATVLALAGAGLTVAMKDFIIGFLGWFILMGKNGIHPGDWVEIEGVGGEVLEVGFLHTILLETGSWTDAGHPTGRKVSFVNSFAIEGHYFNFSTSGQWLWDEIEIQVPEASEPYAIAEGIQKIVTDETSANAKLAEADWKRVTPSYALRSFSAAPALSVQPAGGGVKVLVRYVTRVSERHELRARLYRAVLDLLHRKQIPAPDASLPRPEPVANPT